MDPPPVVNICSITYLQVKKHAAAVDSHDLFPVISCGFDDRRNRNDARVGDRDRQADRGRARHRREQDRQRQAVAVAESGGTIEGR